MSGRSPTLGGVSTRVTPGRAPFALGPAHSGELLARCERAVRRARSGRGEVLAAITVPVPGTTDPSGLAFASRREDEPWFCFEQPDRDGAALAALGCVRAIRTSGPRRFAAAADTWRELAAEAEAGVPDGPAGAGLVAVGGFAFAPEGGAARHWQGFAAADLVVPEVAVARLGGAVALTLAAAVAPGDDPAEAVGRLEARAEALRADPLPLLDPAPVGRFHDESIAPPEHYEGAVARAVERIR